MKHISPVICILNKIHGTRLHTYSLKMNENNPIKMHLSIMQFFTIEWAKCLPIHMHTMYFTYTFILPLASTNITLVIYKFVATVSGLFEFSLLENVFDSIILLHPKISLFSLTICLF